MYAHKQGRGPGHTGSEKNWHVSDPSHSHFKYMKALMHTHTHKKNKYYIKIKILLHAKFNFYLHAWFNIKILTCPKCKEISLISCTLQETLDLFTHSPIPSVHQLVSEIIVDVLKILSLFAGQVRDVRNAGDGKDGRGLNEAAEIPTVVGLKVGISWRNRTITGVS